MSDTDLMTRIIERRQQLDQDYYNDLRELRQLHGDRAVDQALALLQRERDAVAVSAKPKGERGPQHFRRGGKIRRPID
jgi:hypothetical protein